MAKIDENFPHDMFRFLHKPLRDGDKKTFNFLERFLLGPQTLWEQKIDAKLNTLIDLLDPAKTPQPRLLKDHVGFTKELDSIISGVSDDDLRKIISLAVALWKRKGLEVGYKDIIRVFTGANVRIFNWFDFRFIIGEQQFGEAQLGQDSWFISRPGVLGTEDAINTVVGLWTFENNFLDRSPNRNPGTKIGEAVFFNGGPVDGSERYVLFGSPGSVDVGPPLVIEANPTDGFMIVPNSLNYDFSGDFTIEGFVRTNITEDINAVANDGYIFSKIDGLKEISIQYNVSTNELIFRLHDGTTLVTETLSSGFDLDDGTFRHWALTINRDDDEARLWFNGSEATAIADISLLGTLTNNGDIYFSAKDLTMGKLKAGHDEFRIALNQVYPTANATIPVPANAFIEFIEPALDEFYTDIRVVDDGTDTLNRTLLKRIINLMRPISERLNIIYVRFADDFSRGKGNFLTVTGSSLVDLAIEPFVMVMQPNTIEIVDVVGADDFQDIYFQVQQKIQGVNQTAGIVFNWQDIDNHYYFRYTTGDRIFKLSKIVGGVETFLAADVPADIEENTSYILTVTTFKDPFSSDVKIICYQDRNVIFTLTDTAFYKGRFGMRTGPSAIMIVNEIEMFEQPLETDQIEPGFAG